MRSKIVLSLLLPCCAGALLLGAVRCSTAPPTVLDLVLQERQRYEQLFGLELAVCAGATPLDGLLWRGGAGAETALDRCSSVRRGFAQICEASTAAGLVEAVRQAGVACETPWTVEHVPLWSTLRAGARRDDHWRFSGLALALAQTVTGPPALLGASAAPDSCVRFGVLEGETLRFGVLREGVRGAGAADRDAHWAARPFKFSGALDAEVSRAIVNIVVDSRSDATPPPRLFDPCCGSGTNLWAAACRGGSVAGSDRDAAKADGCRRNLEHAGVAFETSASETRRATPYRRLRTPIARCLIFRGARRCGRRTARTIASWLTSRRICGRARPWPVWPRMAAAATGDASATRWNERRT